VINFRFTSRDAFCEVSSAQLPGWQCRVPLHTPIKPHLARSLGAYLQNHASSLPSEIARECSELIDALQTAEREAPSLSKPSRKRAARQTETDGPLQRMRPNPAGLTKSFGGRYDSTVKGGADAGELGGMIAKTTVLFVEDDDSVRDVLPDILPAEEFRSIVVANGNQALQVLNRQRIDVLVTDIVMAGLDGIELAMRAKAMLPHLPIVLMTGYLSQAHEGERIGRLLYKPLRPLEMEAAIREAIAA